MLRGLALVLAAGAQVGHQRDVYEQGVPLPRLQRHLAYRLQERLALYIADGAAYLRYDYVCTGLVPEGVYELLDLVSNVRDYLHGAAQVLSAPLLVQHVPVDAAGGEV